MDNKSTWIKNHMDNFDISMGTYNTAQIAELISIYILDTQGRIIDLKQVGLYWNDGFIFIPDSNGTKTLKIQKLWKKIMRGFKLQGFKIEIPSNFKIVNFLDIIFNLSNYI